MTHVIHVLGPNMNPQRPNCLKDDYVKGCKLLREAYSSVFGGFVSIVESHGLVSEQKSEGFQANDVQTTKRDNAICEPVRNKKYKGLQEDFKANSCVDDEEKLQDKKVDSGKTWAPWTQALYNVAIHPEKHTDIVLDTSDGVLVINDAYPKAQKHVLVLARTNGLDSIADIRREHISLLKKMHEVGLKWAEKFLGENKSLLFRLGYHSVPSMRQLHLHAISQDFDSTHLKNKKHWYKLKHIIKIKIPKLNTV